MHPTHRLSLFCPPEFIPHKSFPNSGPNLPSFTFFLLLQHAVSIPDRHRINKRSQRGQKKNKTKQKNTMKLGEKGKGEKTIDVRSRKIIEA